MILRRLFRKDLSCQEIMEVLQSYLDGETDAAVARDVAGHLGKCHHCEVESQVYDRIRSSLGQRQVAVDPEVMQALNAFGQQLMQDGPPSSSGA